MVSDKLSMGNFSNWHEHVNVSYSYVNSTCFLISIVSTCGLRYGVCVCVCVCVCELDLQQRGDAL
jgi:hypothetical protein